MTSPYDPAAGGFLSRLEGELVLLILKWGEGVHSIPSGGLVNGMGVVGRVNRAKHSCTIRGATLRSMHASPSV